MKLIKSFIDGLFIIEPSINIDDRGYFFESFNKKIFNNLIDSIDFVQDNESSSFKGVLRGLHFQNPPFEQSKLVRCIDGEILDIAVDIRKRSKTYGKFEKVILSSYNKKQLFIPKGFAHGFLTLSDKAIISYKVYNHYSPNHDNGIIWNDPTVNINWGISDSELIFSEKDSKLPPLIKIENPF